MIPLYVIPFSLFLVLASSTSGEEHFLELSNCADHHPVKIRDERERLVTVSPLMTTSWAPNWGKQLHGEQPRETAETRHTSPQASQNVRRKGAAPFSGAEEQIARTTSAYAQYTCLLSLQMGD
jgi:hypothetical protein